jgi:hypothetical protein
VFLSVVGKAPTKVTTADVLAFVTAQRTGLGCLANFGHVISGCCYAASWLR